MEKLIELLNQYEEEKKSDNHWGLTYDNELIWLWNIREARLSVISKEYWFIKWLVDNDKIDLYMLDSKAHNTDIIIELYKYENLKDKDSKRLIMLLSISDTPIDDLILYLK